MAINPISSGAFFSLRLGHAAALTCPRHVIHYRAAASLPLELPCCSIIFLLQHSFSTAWKLAAASFFSYRQLIVNNE